MITGLNVVPHSTFQQTQSTTRFYFPELDGLRFFAFLLVFIHHSNLFTGIPVLFNIQSNCWIGVDLFFVLSSYLFTKLLVKEFEHTNTINFRKFYIRRLFRIWPVYFLFVSFTILCFFMFMQGTPANLLARITGLFTFTDNIVTAIYGYSILPFSAHLWTISYEEQFYLFVPLLILFLVRSSLKKRFVFFVGAFIALNLIRLTMIWIKVPHPAIWVLPVSHFESIIMGIVIGFGGLDKLLKNIKPGWLLLIGTGFFGVICTIPYLEVISYWLIVTYTCVGISTSLILYSILQSESVKKLLSNKIFVFLGKRSYGLYLYHLLGNGVSALLIKQIPALPDSHLASFLYSLAFTIIVSLFSYRLIESPFLVWKKRFEVIETRPV